MGKALWLTKKNGDLVIGPAPDAAPRANEIVVRARAVAGRVHHALAEITDRARLRRRR
jgi:hypothetical protein